MSKIIDIESYQTDETSSYVCTLEEVLSEITQDEVLSSFLSTLLKIDLR